MSQQEDLSEQRAITKGLVTELKNLRDEVAEAKRAQARENEKQTTRSTQIQEQRLEAQKLDPAWIRVAIGALGGCLTVMALLAGYAISGFSAAADDSSSAAKAGKDAAAKVEERLTITVASLEGRLLAADADIITRKKAVEVHAAELQRQIDKDIPSESQFKDVVSQLRAADIGYASKLEAMSSELHKDEGETDRALLSIDKLEVDLGKIEAELIKRSGRIGGLEAHQQAIEARMGSIDSELARDNIKADLIEQRLSKLVAGAEGAIKEIETQLRAVEAKANTNLSYQRQTVVMLWNKMFPEAPMPFNPYFNDEIPAKASTALGELNGVQ